MKTQFNLNQRGSVLVTALMTITILTLLCATSLYVTSQNQTSGMQTASWHQSLTAAESGIDKAIASLNNNSWTGWKVVPYATPVSGFTLPSVEPTASPWTSPAASAGGTPDSTHFNYFPSNSYGGTLKTNMAGEGAEWTDVWITVDTAGMSAAQDTSGKQWYRIRATGKATTVNPARSSMNKLDADLRNTIAMRFNRKSLSTNASDMGPTRTIEVIMAPLINSTGYGPLKLGSGLQASGGATTFDSFKSSMIPGNHQWTSAYRRSHGDIQIVDNTTNSDLRSTYVYGNLAYSGTAVKNNTHVQGTVSTPGPAAPSAAPTPDASKTWTTYTGGGSNPPNSGVFTAGSNSNQPTYIKINGDLVVSSSGNPLHLAQSNNGTNNPIYVWVTGDLKTQGSGYISQDSNVYVTYYVAGDITVSGSSYQNNSGYAAQLIINGMGTNNKATVSSGTSMFTGVIYAPKYDVTISGGADYSGALVADTLTISGGSSFHYDEDLAGSSTAVSGSYSFASWFEDNSDVARSITY